MASRIKSYLQLVRLPNAFTAMADPLAGALVAGGVSVLHELLPELITVMAASAMIYSSGIVFNDYFDREEDRQHRPERPIPSGRVPARKALYFAVCLMVTGLMLAGALTFLPLFHALTSQTDDTLRVIFEGFVARPQLVLALALSGMVLGYDYSLKLFPVARELGMGFCRALNFLLGLTLGFQALDAEADASLVSVWFSPAILLIYVSLLTAVSRLEVRIPSVRIVVKWLVLGIIVLDACFVAAFHGPALSMWVLALLVPALITGKVFESS